MEGISRRELARRAGINESSVRKHIASGALDGAILADGSLHRDTAVKLLRGVITRGTLAAPALRKATDRFTAAQVGILEDEVADLQRRYAPAAEVANAAAESAERIATYFRPLVDTISIAAGRPAKAVHEHARDAIYEALTVLSSDFLSEAGGQWWNVPVTPWWEEATPRARPTPSAVALKTKKLDLSATKLEILRMIDSGELRAVSDVVREASERIATAKSVLLAIPSRVDQRLSAATPAEARALVAKEVGGVLRELGLPS